MKRVVVDLTPLLPGAENGGTKLLSLALIRHLATLAPDIEFHLLTLQRTYEELGAPERRNVRRHLVDSAGTVESAIRRRLRRALRRLPERLQAAAMRVLLKLGATLKRAGGVVRGLRGDLLFCPFTAPFYAEAGIPTLSVIYD